MGSDFAFKNWILNLLIRLNPIVPDSIASQEGELASFPRCDRALITSLPTYCRFHGLAVTKFVTVRSHHLVIQSAVSEDRAETIHKV
jgi:hypothetical protein